MEKKILVADDSLTIQKVVELTFTDSDYRLTCVSNGKLALEAVKNDPPDLILAVVVMPEKNGYEICEEIKGKPATAGIPVVLLAGTFEPFDRDRAERLRCDAIVSKPFDSHQLFRQVESLLANRPQGARPSGPVPADPLEATPVTLHPFPAVPPNPFEVGSKPFDAGFEEEDFTGSIRNLRGMAREEPLGNLYGPEDVDSALAAFQEVEPPSRTVDERAADRPDLNLARVTDPLPHPPVEAVPVAERTEPPADDDGRTQRIDVSRFRAPSDSASPAESAPGERAAAIPPSEPIVAAANVPAPAAAGPGRETSDAEIEALAEKVARRVIEKLSEKIVREIAWDVVPETAELVVRERIRELESGVE
jgi:CheY-like chemotaxis protein